MGVKMAKGVVLTKGYIFTYFLSFGGAYEVFSSKQDGKYIAEIVFDNAQMAFIHLPLLISTQHSTAPTVPLSTDVFSFCGSGDEAYVASI